MTLVRRNFIGRWRGKKLGQGAPSTIGTMVLARTIQDRGKLRADNPLKVASPVLKLTKS